MTDLTFTISMKGTDAGATKVVDAVATRLQDLVETVDTLRESGTASGLEGLAENVETVGKRTEATAQQIRAAEKAFRDMGLVGDELAQAMERFDASQIKLNESTEESIRRSENLRATWEQQVRAAEQLARAEDAARAAATEASIRRSEELRGAWELQIRAAERLARAEDATRTGAAAQADAQRLRSAQEARAAYELRVRAAERAAHAEEAARNAAIQAGLGARQMGTDMAGAAKQVNVLAAATSLLKRLVAGISLVLLVRQFSRMAAEQLETADATGKLSESLGISTEALSVYQQAAKKVNLDQSELTQGFQSLARAQQKVRSELEAPATAAKPVSAALRAIGIRAEEIANVPLDEFFERVANASSEFAGSGGKVAALLPLLGRNATQLIPLLNSLAGDGFARARAEAERFGLIVTEEGARRAADFKDALDRLKGSVRGLAGEFATGLAPAAADAFEAITTGAEDSQSAVNQLGKDSGVVMKRLIGAWLFWSTTIRNTFDFLTHLPFGKSLEGVMKRVEERNAQLGRQLEDLNPDTESDQIISRQRLEEQITEVERAIRAAQRKRGQRPEPFSALTGFTDEGLKKFRVALKRKLALIQETVGDSGDDTEEQKAAAAAQAARVQAAVDAIRAEANLEKVGFDQRQDVADEAYRTGLLSAEAFFQERERIIRAAAAAEVDALDRQADQLQKLPVLDQADAQRRAGQIAQLRDQAAQVIAQRDRELATNANQRAAALEGVHRTALQFERELLEAQGRRTEAAIAGIRAEAEERRRLLVQAGQTPEQARRAVQQREDLEVAQARFEGLSQSVSLVLASIRTEEAAIEDLVARRVITETEGEKRILELQRLRGPILQELREELVLIAEAIQDPATRQALRDLIAQIDGFSASTARAIGDLRDFTDGLIEAVPGVVTDSFTALGDLISGTTEEIENLGDVFREVARIAVSAIQQIIVEMIALKAQNFLQNLLGSGIGTAGGAFAQQFAFAPVGFARGGHVPGVGNRDTVRAMLTPGEFVLRKRAVEILGLDYLRQLNALGGGVSLRQFPRGYYAEGGMVEHGVTGGHISGRVDVGLEPGLVAHQVQQLLGTRAGEEMVLRVVQRNQRAINGTLGRHRG